MSAIHEYRGKQDLYLKMKPETLDKMNKSAIIQSAEFSNRIEGISTSKSRINALLQDGSSPKTRDEEEILGYQKILNTIHSSYASLKLDKNMILNTHKNLYKFQSSGTRGAFKTSDNYIKEIGIDGKPFVRFHTVSAGMTHQYMQDLCESYNDVFIRGEIDPLLLIPCFILDFLCIHPFMDGNGRMSRLLTLLLLYKNNYDVGKYISIERLIDETKSEYYNSLAVSSKGWHNNENDYFPFIRYTLSVILGAYREFEERYNHISNGENSSAALVQNVFRGSILPLSKSEVIRLCPSISQKTIERCLVELQKNGTIIKIDKGKATRYEFSGVKMNEK